MSNSSYILAIAASALLFSACTTQVGGDDDSSGNSINDRTRPEGPDAGPPPDAEIKFDGPCGESGSDAHFVAQDGTCYEYFFQGAAWTGARVQCQSLSGDLAYINDEVTNGLLASLIPSSFPVAWLLGTDNEVEGTWTWAGDAMSYTNWRAGEPNNGGGAVVGENCLVMESDKGGVWDDRKCSELTSYICQR